MTKHIKQRLSVKIFIITLLLLGAACSGTYLFISKLLPTTYSNLINAATEKAAMHLVEQMTALTIYLIAKMIYLIFQRKQMPLFGLRIVTVV